VANAASSGERPLGVFWDVVAFFPRAGHPFAPPCFAERAVPELAEHTRQFLRQPRADPDAPLPAVIMTAHSMGSTISAATILALRGETFSKVASEDPSTGQPEGPFLTDRIAMLSFGSQLRGYFSRFFPSVFGYQVLGVPGLAAPSLWKPDPWQKQIEDEFGLHHDDRAADTAAQAAPADAYKDASLTKMLGGSETHPPRWRNMWRRTDFLGFPAFSYKDKIGDGNEPNPVDRGASETAPGYQWTIAKHSAYLGTEQIELARIELVRDLSDNPTAG
jgi:hypothetical protein